MSIFASETVRLADGPAEQLLAPGVAPVSQAHSDLARERQRRAARHSAAPQPVGGLFDAVSRAQADLF